MASILSKTLEKVVFMSGSKKTFSDPDTFQKLCEDSKKLNALTYQPDFKKFTVDTERVQTDRMTYFILNRKGSTSPDKILYLHGGAYLMEITPEHWKLINDLAKDMGCEFWVPIYPLAPNHTAKEAYEAVMPLYREFVAADQEAAAGKRILMGDSAGAGLAVGLLQTAKAQGLPLADGQVLFSPWVDVTMTNPRINGICPYDPTLDPYGVKLAGEMWAGDLDVKDPMVSPLYGDLALGVRTMILTGTHDILNPDSHALYQGMKKQGQEVILYEEKDLAHVFVMWPIPEAKKALAEVKKFVLEG